MRIKTVYWNILNCRTPVTKFSYFVEHSFGDELIYPSVTKPPVYASLVTRVGLKLFTGKSSVRYSDCFRLYASLPRWSVNRSSVKAALTQTWQQHSQGNIKKLTCRIYKYPVLILKINSCCAFHKTQFHI